MGEQVVLHAGGRAGEPRVDLAHAVRRSMKIAVG